MVYVCPRELWLCTGQCRGVSSAAGQRRLPPHLCSAKGASVLLLLNCLWGKTKVSLKGSREEPPPVSSWGGTSNPQVNPGWLELWLILKRKHSALCWASYSVPSSGFIIRTHTIMPILCIRHTHVLNSQERMGWKRHRRNQLRGQGAHPWGLCLIAPFLGMDKQLWRVMLDDEI